MVYAVRASLRRSNRETTGNDSLILTGRAALDDMQVTTPMTSPDTHHRTKGDNAIREVEEFQVALSAVAVLELVIVPDINRGAARASLTSLHLS